MSPNDASKPMWPGGACWERAHSMVPTPGASSWAVCTRTPGDESQPQQQQQLAVWRGWQHPFIRGEGLVTDGASTCEDRWWVAGRLCDFRVLA